MDIRKFELSDYSTLVKWYIEWELPITPYSWLSEETYIVENGDEPLCVGGVYQLDKAPFFWIESIASNRNSKKEDRKQAIKFLIKHLEAVAKNKGAEIIMGSTPRDSLADTFKELGFNNAPEKYIHLGKKVD